MITFVKDLTTADEEEMDQGSNYTFQKFTMFNSPKNMRQNGTSEQCLIEIEIEHLLNDFVVTTPVVDDNN